jgi:integrase
LIFTARSEAASHLRCFAYSDSRSLAFYWNGKWSLYAPDMMHRRTARTFRKLLSGLRHTCGSLLIAQGVHPRVVMEVLGHSQISMTMNLYAHIIPRLKEGVADKMQQILDKK